jgi:hypothetical protein
VAALLWPAWLLQLLARLLPGCQRSVFVQEVPDWLDQHGFWRHLVGLLRLRHRHLVLLVWLPLRQHLLPQLRRWYLPRHLPAPLLVVQELPRRPLPELDWPGLLRQLPGWPLLVDLRRPHVHLLPRWQVAGLDWPRLLLQLPNWPDLHRWRHFLGQLWLQCRPMVLVVRLPLRALLLQLPGRSLPGLFGHPLHFVLVLPSWSLPEQRWPDWLQVLPGRLLPEQQRPERLQGLPQGILLVLRWLQDVHCLPDWQDHHIDWRQQRVQVRCCLRRWHLLHRLQLQLVCCRQVPEQRLALVHVLQDLPGWILQQLWLQDLLLVPGWPLVQRWLWHMQQLCRWYVQPVHDQDVVLHVPGRSLPVQHQLQDVLRLPRWPLLARQGHDVLRLYCWPLLWLQVGHLLQLPRRPLLRQQVVHLLQLPGRSVQHRGRHRHLLQVPWRPLPAVRRQEHLLLVPGWPLLR